MFSGLAVERKTGIVNSALCFSASDSQQFSCLFKDQSVCPLRLRNKCVAAMAEICSVLKSVVGLCVFFFSEETIPKCVLVTDGRVRKLAQSLIGIA